MKETECISSNSKEIDTRATYTTELLGFASPWVRDEQGSVVADKSFSEFKSGSGVVVFASVGNDGSGQSLTDSVDLRSVTTTRYANLHVDGFEGVAACGS